MIVENSVYWILELIAHCQDKKKWPNVSEAIEEKDVMVNLGELTPYNNVKLTCINVAPS